MNKGNILVIVAIVVALGILGSFVIKSKLNTVVSTPTPVPMDSQILSDQISLTASVDSAGNVTGNTSAYAEVFVNDMAISADANGNFSTKLVLDEGENIILVSANDEEGNMAQETLTVNYE